MQIRFYPPYYCSIETIAYLCDCTKDEIEFLVNTAQFPKPMEIGALKRWNRDEVYRWIVQANGRDDDDK